MNFSDLLDEDGQGTRRCDAWLAENIAGEDVKWDDYWECYKTDDVIVTEAHPVYVKPFTTGDSIDPIWELAKEYFDSISVRTGIRNRNYAVGKFDAIKSSREKKEFTNINSLKSSEQLAIAEALFKAYQKENE